MTHTVKRHKYVCPQCNGESFSDVYPECECCSHRQEWSEYCECDNCKHREDSKQDFKRIDYKVELDDKEYARHLNHIEYGKIVEKIIMFGHKPANNA